MSLQTLQSERAQDGHRCIVLRALQEFKIWQPNACVSPLVVMICSQVKGKWMHLLMPSVCACVSCMLNTQLIFAITGFSCSPLQGTKGRLKNQEWLGSPLFHLVNDEVSAGLSSLTALYFPHQFKPLKYFSVTKSPLAALPGLLHHLKLKTKAVFPTLGKTGLFYLRNWFTNTA